MARVQTGQFSGASSLSRDISSILGSTAGLLKEERNAGIMAAKLERSAWSDDINKNVTAYKTAIAAEPNNIELYSEAQNYVESSTAKMLDNGNKFEDDAKMTYMEETAKFSGNLRSSTIPSLTSGQFKATGLELNNQMESYNAVAGSQIMLEDIDGFKAVLGEGSPYKMSNVSLENKAATSNYLSVKGIKEEDQNAFKSRYLGSNGVINRDGLVRTINDTAGAGGLLKAYVGKDGNVHVDSPLNDEAKEIMLRPFQDAFAGTSGSVKIDTTQYDVAMANLKARLSSGEFTDVEQRSVMIAEVGGIFSSTVQPYLGLMTDSERIRVQKGFVEVGGTGVDSIEEDYNNAEVVLSSLKDQGSGEALRAALETNSAIVDGKLITFKNDSFLKNNVNATTRNLFSHAKTLSDSGQAGAGDLLLEVASIEQKSGVKGSQLSSITNVTEGLVDINSMSIDEIASSYKMKLSLNSNNYTNGTDTIGGNNDYIQETLMIIDDGKSRGMDDDAIKKSIEISRQSFKLESAVRKTDSYKHVMKLITSGDVADGFFTFGSGVEDSVSKVELAASLMLDAKKYGMEVIDEASALKILERETYFLDSPVPFTDRLLVKKMKTNQGVVVAEKTTANYLNSVLTAYNSRDGVSLTSDNVSIRYRNIVDQNGNPTNIMDIYHVKDGMTVPIQLNITGDNMNQFRGSEEEGEAVTAPDKGTTSRIARRRG